MKHKNGQNGQASEQRPRLTKTRILGLRIMAQRIRHTCELDCRKPAVWFGGDFTPKEAHLVITALTWIDSIYDYRTRTKEPAAEVQTLKECIDNTMAECAIDGAAPDVAPAEQEAP